MSGLACGLILLAFSWVSERIGGGEVVFEAGKLGPAVFLHEKHLANKELTCATCHTAVFASHDRRVKGMMKDIQAGKLCGACHDGKKAFSAKQKCGRCHRTKSAAPLRTRPGG
jgi:c(7)-type cytochrome triheme protein